MNVTLYIIIGILVAISGTLVYIIRNLMVKVEKYEDVTVDQTQYLQNISNIIGESNKHLQKKKEKGVRNFKRCLEIIYTKLNLYRLMKPDSKLFDKEQDIKVEFPMNVTKEVVKKMIKKEDNVLAYIHNTMYL